MTPLAIAAIVVGLAALWTLRDVVLRLHRGSEAREAIETARAAEARCVALEASLAARLEEHGAVIARVKAEHESLKGRLAFEGGRRR